MITPPSIALVQCYAPELEKRCRPHLKTTNDSWRVDETYIKIKGSWMYLYRAVDSRGNTLDFWLSPTRDAEAAKRFLHKTLTASHTITPRVITVDKNAAYPKAVNELKASEILPADCELRPIKYLNNIIEQDHRFIKRLRHPGDGFLFLRDGMANFTGIRDDEYASQRPDERSGQGRHCGSGSVHLQPIWGSGLSLRKRSNMSSRLIASFWQHSLNFEEVIE